MTYKYRIISDNGDDSEAYEYKADSYSEALDELSYDREAGYAVIIREADNFVCYDTRHHEILKAYEDLSAEDYASGIRPMVQANKTAAYQSVYIDIDGTAAYWHKDGKGFSYPEGILDPKNHYYRDLDPHQFIIDLAKELHKKGFDVCILSATDRNCMVDRWEWIEQYMPFIPKENIFMCPIGSDKKEFCKGNADVSVLIDDYENNLDEWSGTGIKSINSINSYSDKHMNIDTFPFETIDKDHYQFNIDETVRKIHSALHELEVEKFGVEVFGYNYMTAPAVKNPYADFHLHLNKKYFERVKEVFPEKIEFPIDIDVVARINEHGRLSLIGCTNTCVEENISDILDKEFLDCIELAISSDTEILLEDHVTAFTAMHKMRQKTPDKTKPKFEIGR